MRRLPAIERWAVRAATALLGMLVPLLWLYHAGPESPARAIAVAAAPVLLAGVIAALGVAVGAHRLQGPIARRLRRPLPFPEGRRAPLPEGGDVPTLAVAYRDAAVVRPDAVPTLCARHAALDRQNRGGPTVAPGIRNG